MALLNIVHYPDPILSLAAQPFGDDQFDDNLQTLVSKMFETMEKAGGVGLAAPQIGISKRLFVMDVHGEDESRERYVLINPEIINIEGEVAAEEGCLSFPGLFQVVKRETRVIARARDVNGDEFELDVRNLAARCLLHETDHCDGIVFLDRMTPLKRELAKRKIKTLQKTGKWN